VIRDNLTSMPVPFPASAWVLPDEPVPVRLMSTIWADTEGIHDELRTPRDVDRWLDAIGEDRAGVHATTTELSTARGLRDAVRRLAAHVTADTREAGGPRTGLDDAIGQVNSAAAKSPASALILRDGHLERSAQSRVSPVTAGLARVAEHAIEMLGGDDAAGLRACHAPGCVLYFVKTHPRREWCSVPCGNRARAARHYQKVRTRREPPDG
jgi:predicted RNA-binding Zn ribbon-like protein